MTQAPQSTERTTLPAPPQQIERETQDDLFFDQALSWLRFNERVLEEALTTRIPLLERVRFLAIFANNLDEFFMIRITELQEQVTGGTTSALDGTQLAAIRETLTGQLALLEECWERDLLPKLREQGIRVCSYSELKANQRKALRDYFAREIFPVLTPLAFDPAHPFPHISNLSLNLAVVVNDDEGRESFARVKVPDVFSRLVPMPGEAAGGNFVWLEDVVAANLDLLFPGLRVTSAHAFRITRDADFEMKADGAPDLLTNIEELIELRQWGDVVRMEIDQRTPERIRDILMRNLELPPHQVYQSSAHLGLASLAELTRIERPELKFPPYVPATLDGTARKGSFFELIPDEGILLYHPYDSFTPVVDFIREAANDPQVLAIKQTLYRVGSNTPIIDALMEARQNGKQVAVLLEIQARFDEENNIAWGRALEDEGVHVVYGVLGLKTHAKMCMIVRRESHGLRRYVHMSTGNYNTITSRIYTDLSYFTSDEVIGADVADIFNALTGYSRKDSFRKLLVAPSNLRNEIIKRIDREIECHKRDGNGYIAFKMNALVDRACIRALYRASQAGVKVDLQVRGICCLRPGVAGLSETIEVTSIVGRFLEHARIFYFRNGGNDEVLLGSADLMPRNLDRRVEILFPIEPARLRQIILRNVLEVHLRDNVQARRLLPDGHYERLQPQPGQPVVDSQRWLMANWKEVARRGQTIPVLSSDAGV